MACKDPVLMNKNTSVESIHTITVPGALAVYNDTLKHFGSKKFSLADVISPTIKMAEEG
jgi:gamma-glutamyltranspeptidase/glutathione hydrolase